MPVISSENKLKEEGGKVKKKTEKKQQGKA